MKITAEPDGGLAFWGEPVKLAEKQHPTLPFAPHKLARASNPETSKAAARACRELRGKQHEAILRALQIESRPMTACEIANATLVHSPDGVGGWHATLDKHQAGRRLGELVAEGYVAVVDKAGLTDAGRPAQRYALAVLQTKGEAQ